MVEAFRSNQKLLEVKPTYQPSAIGVGGTLVAIGGEVCRKTRFMVCSDDASQWSIGPQGSPERMGW